MLNRCPGQDSAHLKVETITCKNCGYAAEIFSDEVKLRCPKCRNFIYRQKLPSCIDWCKMARECIGKEKWEQRKGE